MAHFELLEVVRPVVQPVKGRMLAKLFAEWVGDHYGNRNDPELIEGAERVHFKVDVSAFSPMQIMDFIYRLPALKDAGKLGEVTLEYNKPDHMGEDTLHHNTLRVMRSFEGEDVKWTNQDDSLLDHTSITDLLFQYFLRDQFNKSTIKDLQKQLEQAGLMNKRMAG